MSAQIRVNGVLGSNDDLPINTIVTLSNATAASTYAWAILDQPAGAADNLSSTSSATPFFTPRKEGTYLLRLTVDAGLPTESTNQVIAAIRQVKSRLRIPAAGETIENNPTEGWAPSPAADAALLAADDARRYGPLLTCAVIGGTVDVGVVALIAGAPTIKTGLPGEEAIFGCIQAFPPSNNTVNYAYGVVERAVDGSSGPFGVGVLVSVRIFGLRLKEIGVPTFNGDPVFISDIGLPALTPGTNKVQIGTVIQINAGTYDWMIDGHLRSPFPQVHSLTLQDDSAEPISAATEVKLRSNAGVLEISAGGAAWVPISIGNDQAPAQRFSGTAKGAVGAAAIYFMDYGDFGSATPYDIPMASNKVYRSFVVNVKTNTFIGNTHFTIYVNGVATALTEALFGGSIGVFVITTNVPVVPNDLVNLRFDAGAGELGNSIDFIAVVS